VTAAAHAAGSRYEMLVKIASGGMATVFVGRAHGVRDLGQLVAIKRPHPHLVEDDSFRRMLFAEANLASRIHHANVVSVRDVEVHDESLHLVMDYVEGVSFAELLALGSKSASREDLGRVGLRILLDACAGLHAAHELADADGRPLGLVHRDVSPHNILVGVDGIARVVDFGIAKCVHQRDGMTTSTGTVKGKTAYMAPEYMAGRAIDRRSDVFAMGILLWEALAAQRLFRGQNDAETITRVLGHTPAAISTVAPFCGTRFDAIVASALAKDPEHRFSTMHALAEEITMAARGTELVARHTEVAHLLELVASERLASRRARVRALLERTAKSTDDDDLGSTAPLVLKTNGDDRVSTTQSLVSVTRTARVPVMTSAVKADRADAPPVRARRPVLPIGVGLLVIASIGGVFTYVSRHKEPSAISTPVTANQPSASAASEADSVSSVAVTADGRSANVEPSASSPPTRPGARRPRTPAGVRPSATTPPSAPTPTPVSPATGETPRPLPTNPYHR
jgi:serine/threonine protein kinase